MIIISLFWTVGISNHIDVRTTTAVTNTPRTTTLSATIYLLGQIPLSLLHTKTTTPNTRMPVGHLSMMSVTRPYPWDNYVPP